VDFDYTTIGHVTVDVMADGSRRAGGTAFYSALQAARLGQRALIITRGRAEELAPLLEPYLAELELELIAADRTTTLYTSGSGARRAQRVLAWAPAITAGVSVDTRVLHLAPVAREMPGGFTGRAGFVGLTPQGLARTWDGEGGEISLAPPAGRCPDCEAIVVSEHELASCERLISEASGAGAIVAITAAGAPTRIRLPGGEVLEVQVPPVEDPRDDLGAGDVFAAAFFVALREGQPPAEAASFANAAAAVRMRGVGAQAIGDRAAIEERLGSSAGSRA
jgi:sugar/nucleoside kinase (ribokinase family)